jgi:hypothetical protein
MMRPSQQVFKNSVQKKQARSVYASALRNQTAPSNYKTGTWTSSNANNLLHALEAVNLKAKNSGAGTHETVNGLMNGIAWIKS